MSSRKAIAINLGILLGDKPVYATPTGLKLTSRGKVLPPLEVLAEYATSKSERRKVRRTLSRIGRRDLALASLPQS